VIIAARVDDRTGDDLRNLRKWLIGDNALPCRVDIVAGPSAPGELGGLNETLTIMLGSGGTSLLLATAVVEWIRARHTSVRLTLTKGDAHIDVEAARIQRLDADGLAQVVERIAAMLDSPSPTAPPSPPPDADGSAEMS
jgi:hypothetical protein